ncbi:MAG: peptide-methionine (S)-S-oxide reductase [Planctomycetaceae bacterium]|nr:peptide-methionine (S)-S-oxide reductase [Planctomycetaceae bacterium]
MLNFPLQSLYRCCIPFVILVSTLGSSCSTAEPTGAVSTVSTPANQEKGAPEKAAVATFGAGCFWCVEAVFEELEGVLDVSSGYTGGTVDNPTYRDVCTGLTGHAEVCQIQYDSANISYDELLEVFWKTHDPTTLNRQGPDSGTQYRSVIFYHNIEQKELAEQYKQKLDASGAWDNPLVTEISPLPKYYPAEDYHQDYFKLNPNQRYCSFVIRPKVKKFKSAFPDKLKQKDR